MSRKYPDPINLQDYAALKKRWEIALERLSHAETLLVFSLDSMTPELRARVERIRSNPRLTDEVVQQVLLDRETLAVWLRVQLQLMKQGKQGGSN